MESVLPASLIAMITSIHQHKAITYNGQNTQKRDFGYQEQRHNSQRTRWPWPPKYVLEIRNTA